MQYANFKTKKERKYESASDGVRLAIDAPKQISILREELSIAEQENKEAISPKAEDITNLQDSLRNIIVKSNLRNSKPGNDETSAAVEEASSETTSE